MNCPNCGRPYEADASFCPLCNTPLGNAFYVPVTEKPKKRGKTILFLICFLLILGTAGGIGYYAYIEYIKRDCRQVAEHIMTCASQMNFSEYDADSLPSPFNRETDTKELVSQAVDGYAEEIGLNQTLSVMEMDKDYDAFYQELLKHADYRIENVEATYDRCQVTVTCSNVNYYKVLDQVEEELSGIVEEAQSSAGWWGNLKEWISSLLSQKKETEEDIPDTFSGWAARMAESQPLETTRGSIIFGIRDKHWVILSADENLFNTYYGFPDQEE